MKKFLIYFLATSLFIGCKLSKNTENSNELNNNIDLFNDSIVHTIHLNFKQVNYFDSLIYFKDVRDEKEETTYLMASTTIDGQTLDSVGVRIKGESSYEYYPGNKKSLKIAFDRFRDNQSYQKTYKINLNNCFKDPTFIREKLYLDALTYIGAPAQKSSFAKVYINHKYWGLYLVVEQIDKKFLKRNFGNSKGNFYQGEPKPYFTWLGEDSINYVKSYVRKSKVTPNLYTDIKELCRKINLEDSNNNAYLDSLNTKLNVTPCLKSWVVNSALLNIDTYNMWYPHNFFIYQNTKTNRFEWINYDGNYSFGAWTPEFTLEQLEKFDILFVKDSEKNILTKKLLNECKPCKQVYLNEFKTFLPFIESNAFENRVKFYADLIREAVYQDIQKMYTDKEFELNLKSALGDVRDPGAFIPGLTDFTKSRRIQILKQLSE